MAQSPAHRFGQIIGNLIEKGLESTLRDVADEHGLYLDKQEKRPARQNRKKVKWTDHFGNHHDLDYVFEEGGTPEEFGMPIAFIESAWRRYTKHARNKAQEIQGAVKPLMQTYWRNVPFAGAIIAGGFTRGSIEQLKSQGFEVLHFGPQEVVTAFASVGINGRFGEDTSEEEFQRKITQWKALSKDKKRKVMQELLASNKEEVDAFIATLVEKIERRITAIRVLPLYGNAQNLSTVEAAISFVEDHSEESDKGAFQKYEITIEYSNGDEIDAQFQSKKHVVEFLRPYQDPHLTPVRY